MFFQNFTPRPKPKTNFGSLRSGTGMNMFRFLKLTHFQNEPTRDQTHHRDVLHFRPKLNFTQIYSSLIKSSNSMTMMNENYELMKTMNYDEWKFILSRKLQNIDWRRISDTLSKASPTIRNLE